MSIFQTNDLNINNQDIEFVKINNLDNNGGWVEVSTDYFEYIIVIPFDKLIQDVRLKTFKRHRIAAGNVIYFGRINEDQNILEHTTNTLLPEQIHIGDIVQIHYNIIVHKNYVVSIDGIIEVCTLRSIVICITLRRYNTVFLPNKSYQCYQT